MLAKGLIGIVLPLAVLVPWLLAQRRWADVLALASWRGLLLFAVVAGPWLLLMQWRYPGFVDYFIVEQHFRRYAGTLFNNRQPVWFFWVVLPLLMLPWTLWLWPASRRNFRSSGSLRAASSRARVMRECAMSGWAAMTRMRGMGSPGGAGGCRYYRRKGNAKPAGKEGEMTVIVVANPKGGVGKSTIATNLAGCLAAAGRAVMLGDIDRQLSSRHWLALRPAQLPSIRGWDIAADDIVRPPKGTTHVVLDTPAGLRGKRLDATMRIADRLLIPLQASLFDIQATHAFLKDLLQHRRAGDVKLGLVAMRVRETTRANDQLLGYLATLQVPLVASLRDTQNYVQLAARGLTLWDVAPSRVERDLAQWEPLARWAGA